MSPRFFWRDTIAMKPLHPLVPFAVFSLFTLGCGGSSAGGSTNASITLSVSTNNLAYGQPTTISWSSQNVDFIESASFPVNTSTVNGSFTDKPTVPTTYKITAHGTDGGSVSSLITVSVQKGSKKILFLADTAQSGVNQATDFLQTLSTQSVQVSHSLPGAFSADVIVIGSSAAVSPSDVPAIKSFMNAGGGVVLIRYATRLLATGNLNDDNISSIGSFCAGVTSSSGFTPFRSAQIVSGSVTGFPLSANLFGQTVSGQGAAPVSASATLLTGQDDQGFTMGFTYQPATGGKISFVGDAPIDSSSESVALRTLFLSEVRWASGE